MLSHTEQGHPTERDIIDRLRIHLLRAAVNPHADGRKDASNPNG